MPSDDMPVQEEQYESIPWSHLVEQARPQPWLTYVAAAAVVAVVLGVVIARSAPPVLPVPEAVSTTSPTTVPPVTTARRQHDLMAQPVLSDQLRAAVARAEWFVRDYFTIDGAGGRDEEVAGALGRPAAGIDGEATTYVEWARAFSARADGERGVRVMVAYRSITQTEAGFERGLTRAVAIGVDVSADGGTRVRDLPEPVELPPAPAPAGLAEPAVLPQPVADQALDLAARWGEPVAVLAGADVGDRWRVVLTIADEFGTPWPMVVHVADE